MMARYSRILSADFGQTALPLPVSLRLARRAEALPAAGQDAAFPTSVQTATRMVTAELRMRAVAVAESLLVGDRRTLTVRIGAADGGAGRTVRMDGAVLTAVEIAYDQTAPAVATLRFTAEAPDGTAEPFAAEETP